MKKRHVLGLLMMGTNSQKSFSPLMSWAMRVIAILSSDRTIRSRTGIRERANVRVARTVAVMWTLSVWFYSGCLIAAALPSVLIWVLPARESIQTRILVRVVLGATLCARDATSRRADRALRRKLVQRPKISTAACKIWSRLPFVAATAALDRLHRLPSAHRPLRREQRSHSFSLSLLRTISRLLCSKAVVSVTG